MAESRDSMGGDRSAALDGIGCRRGYDGRGALRYRPNPPRPPRGDGVERAGVRIHRATLEQRPRDWFRPTYALAAERVRTRL